MEKDKYFTGEEQNVPQNQETKNQFSADLEKVRDAMLKQLEPFDTPEKIKKLKRLVNKSGDTLRILAGLAARILIIREKLTELANYRLGKSQTLKPPKVEDKKNVEQEDNSKKEEDPKKNWVFVRTVRQGDINGIDLDEGMQIKVSPEDVKRLTEAGLVEVVTTENKQDDEEAKPEKAPAKKGKKGADKESKSKAEVKKEGEEKQEAEPNTEILAKAVAEAEAEDKAPAEPKAGEQEPPKAGEQEPPKTGEQEPPKAGEQEPPKEETESPTQEKKAETEDTQNAEKGKLSTENIGENKKA